MALCAIKALDDDIDIEMPYPDYKRFLSIAQAELGDGYFVQHYKSEEHFSCLFCKVRKNNTTLLSKYEIGSPGHHGVWIDIFPMISVGGEFDYKYRKTLVRICNFLTYDDQNFSSAKKWIRSQTNAFVFAVVRFVRLFPLGVRKAMRSLLEKMLFCGHSRKTKRRTHIWTNITSVQPYSVYSGEPALLQFEDALFPAPPLYDEYLKNAYGDYMTPPPENKRNGGHGEVIIDLEQSWEIYNQK